MLSVAKFGNIASKSDIEVGVRALEMGIWGAYKNVLINLPGISDKQFVQDITAEATKIMNNAKSQMEEILSFLDKRLE